MTGASLVTAAWVLALRPATVSARAEGVVPAFTPVTTRPSGLVSPAAAALVAPHAAGRTSASARARAVPLAAPPVHVSLPAARTDASVVPVGGSRSSGLELPADPRLVGWWAFGAAPGAAGSVVLAGHIDAYDRGVGTFAALTTVRVGAPVAVTDSRGQVHDYRVVARRTYRKERLPQSIYTATGLPRLVLVTCGGQFRHGHYDSNIVVYALPR